MQFLNFYSALKQRNKQLKVFRTGMRHQVLTSQGDQYTQVCTFTHEEMLAL